MSQPRTVGSVQTTFDIIDALKEFDGAGVTELADALSLSKGTVHSHLATLWENEYVVREQDGYHLSFRYLDLAEDVKSRFGQFGVIEDELRDLADKTGELAQFATEEHGRTVYLSKAEGTDAVQTASRPGMRENLHCVALGKAILSQLPRTRVEEIVDRHGLERRTEHTITTREELHAELEEIRNRGYAYDEEEKIEGLHCVASPVTYSDGGVFGAVSVSGPSKRLEGELFRTELPKIVVRSANVIEINAKYS